MNVERDTKFSQVCVWPGALVEHDIDGFVKFMLDEFDIRVQYLEEIVTQPDTFGNGDSVPGTGGRNDLFFAVHQSDIPKFAVKRLPYGIRWVEDVLSQLTSPIYPERVFGYMGW